MAMQTVTPKPERARDPLLIVQIMLSVLLVVTLTLGAIADRRAPATTPPADLSGADTQAALTATAQLTEAARARTPTAEISQTTAASETPSPMPTSTPTLTPTITATATPLREPIPKSGRGDLVFYPQKWIGPAIVHITYGGKGPFVAWTQNDNAEREDLLANSSGPYEGNSLIDYLGNQRTLRFEVRTSDSWQIEVLPLSMAKHLAIPGIVQGNGDDVVVLQGPYAADLLSVDANPATGRFVVWGFGAKREAAIDAVAPYTGTVSLPRDTTILAIKAVGPWRLEITTR